MSNEREIDVRIRNTTRDVVLQRGAELRDYVVKKFVERFGTDEVVDMVNERRITEFHKWWGPNVASSKDGVISVKEYQDWVELVRRLLPKKYSKKKYDMEIIVADMMYGPMTIEMRAEIKKNKELEDTNNNLKEVTE